MPKVETGKKKKDHKESLRELKKDQKIKKDKGYKPTIGEIEARLEALEEVVLQSGGYR